MLTSPSPHATTSDEYASIATLLNDYMRVRSFSELLCDPLFIEDYVVQSMPDVSPPKWHLAHTSWFFETFLLVPHLPTYSVFDDRFLTLFNSYYRSLGDPFERARRGLLSRPSVRDVYLYRLHVDEAIRLLFSRTHPEGLDELLILGMQHEQQHQELLVTDIKHILCSNPLGAAYQAPSEEPGADPVAHEWIPFEGGLTEIGHTGAGFAFDHEKPRHRVYLHPYELGSRLVTQAEYLEFMEDGGYENPSLWLADGWDWLMREGIRAPLYWHRVEDRWKARSLCGLCEIEPEVPVHHVSYYEADAFARWRGARLATEVEWENAADSSAARPHGSAFAEARKFSPSAARMQIGIQQLFGEVWEWSASAFVPYPGFTRLPDALGEYNGKFMSNQMVLRGGSCATPLEHIRATYRNFFPPQARWQFSGIRLARSR